MQAGDGTTLELAGAQWSFTLALYGRPGVADACLLLQDRLGADVCLLLFSLFVAREHGWLLDDRELANLDRAVAAWRAEVVWPLRALRRRMKTGPDPAPSTATDPLLQQIKAAEICAEQIELAALARLCAPHPPAPRTTSVQPSLLLDRLGQFFAARSGNPAMRAAPEIAAALEVLAAALQA